MQAQLVDGGFPVGVEVVDSLCPGRENALASAGAGCEVGSFQLSISCARTPNEKHRPHTTTARLKVCYVLLGRYG